MKNFFKAKLLYCALLTFCFAMVTVCSGKVYASGFALYEWSARGNALGGTLVARADDPSAVAYNPAGITQLNGTQTLAGFTTLTLTNSLITNYGGDEKNESLKEQYYLAPHAYLTHQINDNAWFGLGLYSKYGLGTKYSETWRGRYSSYDTSIETYSVNPNLAYKFNKYFSAAIGMELMYVKADLRCKRDPTGVNNPDSSGATDIDQRIRVDGITPGFNAALRVTPNDQWAIGFVYRSQMNHHAKGDVTYDSPAGISSPLYFNDTNVTMAMSTPNTYSIGVAYKPFENFSIEGDAIFSQWSSFKNLSYRFESATAIGRKEADVAKKWSDVWRFQLGVEYSPVEDLDLRVGYVYDQSPIRDGYEDYMMPTNDRQIISTGVGLHFGETVLDLSYSYLWMKDRKIEARAGSGVLDTTSTNNQSHMFAASLKCTF
ncbi:OmpP1/FadL family transporter [Maridesulfovibrio bastinii]|uniref:OmpP1/FadL family transporter n=1 Tax=Maridesulfovibrio bastinii TaxID=47157 RepID=UPI00040F7A5E|nr:OmpP1/FadL family transporter [Maridesulfovibrio bastinii]